MRDSWVMLDSAHHYVPLPREKTLFTSPPRTALALEAGNTFPGTEPVAISCASGTAYLTNQRVGPIFQLSSHNLANWPPSPSAHLPSSRSHPQIPVLFRSDPESSRHSCLGPLLWSQRLVCCSPASHRRGNPSTPCFCETQDDIQGGRSI